jgi:hypothetical protein
MAEPVLIKLRAIQGAQLHPRIARSLTPSNRDADSRLGRLPGALSLRYGVSAVQQGPLLEAGSPPGTKSWARSVSVPIALLRSSSRRFGSISIAFEVTTFGYRRGKICRARAISLMSRLTPIYTIYSLLSTTSGLGVRHTGPAGRTVGSTERVPLRAAEHSHNQQGQPPKQTPPRRDTQRRPPSRLLCQQSLCHLLTNYFIVFP